MAKDQSTDKAPDSGVQAKDEPTAKTEKKREPSAGRIVLYKISETNAATIASKRSGGGRQGNHHLAGDVVPLIVVRVWPNEYGPGIPGVNGQLMLDGDDQLWITSAREGEDFGQWHWPTMI